MYVCLQESGQVFTRVRFFLLQTTAIGLQQTFLPTRKFSCFLSIRLCAWLLIRLCNLSIRGRVPRNRNLWFIYHVTEVDWTACSSRWKGPSSVSLKGGDWLSKISVKLTPSCVLAKIRSRNWTWLKANEPNCSKLTGSRNCMVCEVKQTLLTTHLGVVSTVFWLVLEGRH